MEPPGKREVPVFDLVDHLFRHEAGRLVAALVRIFGVHNLELAEDVVQETFCRVLEVWKYRGVPDNPSAWLMRAARNRAIDVIRRERTFRRFAPDLSLLLESDWTLALTVDEYLVEHRIPDDQLRMMFSCCHPEIAVQAQVCLILKTLCGFSSREIAQALLAKPAAIEKRLYRAKQVLKAEGGLYEVSDEAQIAARADAVHQAIYLIFNEGYHGSHPQETIREALCQEALRLGALLTGHRVVAAESQALVALMCFHLARLTARMDGEGRLVPLEEQDRSRWERPLIEQGVRFLERSAQGERVSAYHLEAGIAALHCLAASHEETDWTEIIALYDLLYGLTPTPIVALNRAIAIGQAEGPGKALEELNRIPGARKLKDYPFYPAALGEFHRRAGHREEARDYFAQALRLARSPSESRFLERKLEVCG